MKNMIKKIVKVKNIGKFIDYSASGDVQFDKLTIIYAENGSGKTTLSEIFRSLKESKPVIIKKRKSLYTASQQDSDPEVQLLTDLGAINFKKETDGSYKWSAEHKDLDVFDIFFVDSNVYSGFSIDSAQKQNLHRFIVGEDGVKLAEEIEGLKQQNNEATGQKTRLAGEIDVITGRVFNADVYANLSEDKGIDAKIKAVEDNIALAKNDSDIKSKAKLEKIKTPISLDTTTIKSVFNKDIENIKSDFLEKINQQKAQLKISGVDNWLDVGTKNITERDGKSHCPYCSQDLDPVKDLIDSYQNYFSKDYADLKTEVAKIKNIADSLAIDAGLRILERNISTNVELYTFWKTYVGEEDFSIDYSSSESDLKAKLVLLKESIDEKVSKPTEKINIESIDNFSSALDSFNRAFDDYNERVEKYNEKIQGIKDQAKLDLPTLSSEKKKLELEKKRFSDASIQEKCRQYLECLSQIEGRKKTIEEKDTQLKEASGDLFTKYGEGIKKSLKNFTDDFTIDGLKDGGFVGRSTSKKADYQIIHCTSGTSIPMEEAEECACFKNVLSEGDKNALAFSFFIARVQEDSGLASKTVIIDDPLSSLDVKRKEYTANCIVSLANSCQNVVLLTHNIYFAKIVWDLAHKKGLATKALQIKRNGTNGSAICEFDIDKEAEEQYFKDFQTLDHYLSNGYSDSDEFLKIARSIRPFIEGYLRMKYPGEFGKREWLGDMISKIKTSGDKDRLSSAKKDITELESINDYSGKYHHNTNVNADSEAITDSELKIFVQKTLDYILK